MTSLAVRASSVKNCDDLKKNTETRFILLQLPSTKVFNDKNAVLENFKNEYSSAKVVDHQLSAVNKLIVHLASDEPSELGDEIICQVLTDLYFNAPIKHPLRSILAKALHKAAAKKNEIIINAMSKTITERNSVLCGSLGKNDSKIEDISFFVSSLNCCFENFPEASAAVRSCFLLLLKSHHQFIDILSKLLQSKNSLSPARRSEVFVILHHTIRVVLSGVQQFNGIFLDSSILEPILSQCWYELMDNPAYIDSPIDTKINCGILKVNYDRLFGDIFAPREEILNQIDKVTSPKSNSIPSKEIFYAIAIINTTVEKDFTDPNYYPALKVIVDRLIEVGNEFTIDSCIIMAVTRALVQCTKKLLILLRKVSGLTADDEKYLRAVLDECLGFVWINVHHSVDCVRYLTKDLLKNLLRLGQEQPKLFDKVVNEIIEAAVSNNTNEILVCLLLDYLSQVFTTGYVLTVIPDIQQRILNNLFNDSCWALCYEQLMSKNSGIELELWCTRWIQPLMKVSATDCKNDFDRLRTIRNLFERALKTKPEAAEFILADKSISIEIYLFVLWIMRRSGRKMYAPENYRASGDSKVIYAKIHPSDEIRILAFRILIECHKMSAQFPVEDLNEILEFFRYNCNAQNPAIRQQINTTMKRAMARIECGYATAKRTPSEDGRKLCNTYQTFLFDLIEFCVNWCLFDGSNFGRRSTGLATLLYAIDTWQKILPDNESIYTQKLWIRLQKTLSDSYVVNKDVAIDILLICWKFYPDKLNLIHSLKDLKKLITTFRPYDTMTAAHYLVFCAFSKTYFDNYYEAVIWCEKLLDDGLTMAKKSLLQTARYNSLYGLVMSMRQLLLRVDFSKISSDTEISNWRLFFQRIIRKCRELTDVSAPVVNSSAPEGHLPNDLNDISHYLEVPQEEDFTGTQIKVTAQMILLCAWRTVRESALLLGEIALRVPVLTITNPNGIIEVNQLLQMGSHFQQLLVETKHRGAFEQSFLGFSNLCLRLWRSHEPQLHSYPMKLVEKIAKIISGESTGNEDAEIDVKKLCATRRSAGVPFMIQGVVTTESQVCSSLALTFCMKTFMEIVKTGKVEESRTHSLNILRSLFKCAELGEAVSEYIADGIECSIRGYSAPSWPERNSSTLLFSALMTRVFGVQRSKISENISIKNKMTGRLFFIRYPQLFEFFLVELKNASEAIERNERPPRLHPLLLLISRLYPSAREGSDCNLKLSTFIPFISTCSSSPELVTRQLSAKSMTALIPYANIIERILLILKEFQTISSVNAVHGYLLQILYLIQSYKHQYYDIDIQALKAFAEEFIQLKLPSNNIIGNTYLEILLEILLIDQFYPVEQSFIHRLTEIRGNFVRKFAESNQYDKLTQSYIQKTFTLFNLLLSIYLENTQLPVLSHSVFNTQYELIETQLNIKYLLLSKPLPKSFATYDYSHYELELVKFIERNRFNEEKIQKLLLSTTDLYYIINHKREFYPYGVMKAYAILSILISPDDSFNDPKLLKLTFDQLLDVMATTSDDEEVDDVTESIWKFITAHLKHYQVNPSQVSSEQMKNIISHLRYSTISFKSSNLRQTVTETFSIIVQYFEKCTNLELIIDIAELLLTLLRDDDVYVRNRISEIVMDLIRKSENQEISDKVIPLAAEDHLLQWLDTRFSKISSTDAWSNWYDLLHLVYTSSTEKVDEKIETNNDDNHLIDVDIFDDTEPNTFDESIYTSYKCYTFLVKHIKNSTLTDARKEEIFVEFENLRST